MTKEGFKSTTGNAVMDEMTEASRFAMPVANAAKGALDNAITGRGWDGLSHRLVRRVP